ncbi:hypothetical protein [Fodinicola acaciae]|uniref:hypothetical protein n=1 Tax=Fodinicola acaciae TaxID=2681555 RepID=UPI001C9EA04F|nr:hypothetical protein [Fodinicola acaciae]
MSTLIRTATVVGVAAAAVGTAATGVSAAPAPAKAAAFTCFVNTNNVNYRSGPGTQYPSYGQVNRGQGFDGRLEAAGGWSLGNLWGGRSDVWIYTQYLDC